MRPTSIARDRVDLPRLKERARIGHYAAVMERTSPSPFEAILRRIGRAGADDGRGQRGPISCAPCFVAETLSGAGEAAADLARDHYRETIEDGPRAAEHVVAVTALPSVEIEDVARELDLAGCPTVELLKARRRDFARDNHPDRLDPAACGIATERMMIANRLIDAEIARLRGAARA